ncbi:MAG: hypothetical protein C0601_10185 [Candidatus Muiribacterium halophilum]|uniref:Uncharacterized protein n=1 Tax=Muiribacterium halophilum TaxID=2053465 RepID=A0A2N5ZCM7_MUIH1|nr:MAG: hypothetical protein C0601_10185 [Candidatus Muirbacterium halophilum]
MKLRSRSISEKVLYYVVGIIAIVIMLAASVLIRSSFSKKVKDLESREEELKNQVVQLKSQVQKKQLELQQLDVAIEKKQKEKVQEEKEYKEKKDVLEGAKELLPSHRIKPDIMQKLMEELKNENLNIIYFNQRQGLSQGEYDFIPVIFEMEVSGDYYRMKHFLFFVEKPLQLKDDITGKTWNVLLKIPYPNGLKFYRYVPAENEENPNHDLMTVSPDVFNSKMMAFASETVKIPIQTKPTNRRGTQPQQPQFREETRFSPEKLRDFLTNEKDLKSEDYRLISTINDNDVRVKIEIITYFVED